MKTWKHILVAACAAMACAVGIPMAGMTAEASGMYDYENPPIEAGALTFYRQEDETLAVAYCDHTATAVEIPSEVDGIPVTTIYYHAFLECSDLTEITIPDSITTIYDGAFENTPWLEAQRADDPLVVVNGVVVDGKMCSGMVTIPDNVSAISGGAFYGNPDITGVIIPENVTHIGSGAFSNCSNLENVSLAGSHTYIENGAFLETAWLIQQQEHDPFVVLNGTLIDATACEGDVVIPDGVTVIGEYAFMNYDEGRSVTSITIPDSVTRIETGAFNSCELSEITIPASVTNIDQFALDYSGTLTAITVSEDNTSYSSIDGVLYDKAQTTLIRYPNGKSGAYNIPDGVTTIGESSFSNCTELTALTLSDSVVQIGDDALNGCTGLTSLSLGAGLSVIGDWVFSGCDSLTNLTISAENTTYYDIDGVLFRREPMELIYFPTGMGGSYAVPDGTTAIADDAFMFNENITSVTLPDSLTSIGNEAFRTCMNLQTVNLPTGLTSIGYYAFAYCDNLTEITIPDSVTELKKYAFNGCNRLDTIMLPDGLTTIEESMFGWCPSLTSVTIPNNVIAIEANAFSSCDALTDIYYDGTEEQWKSITIDNGNSALSTATIHFADGTIFTGITTGDLDGDGNITIQDAFNTLIAYTKASAGLDDDLTDAQRRAADVDGDGSITISDAFRILIYYATEAAGGTPSWN